MVETTSGSPSASMTTVMELGEISLSAACEIAAKEDAMLNDIEKNDSQKWHSIKLYCVNTEDLLKLDQFDYWYEFNKMNLCDTHNQIDYKL